MRTYILVFLTVILLAACGPVTQIPPQQPLPTASRDLTSMNWTSIKLTQSGGIMGISRSIEVLQDGKWTINDERTNRTMNGQLPATDLSELVGVVSMLSDMPSRTQSACADCFIYTIEISTTSGTITAQTNDVDLPNSSLSPLVAFLRGWIDRTLK